MSTASSVFSRLSASAVRVFANMFLASSRVAGSWRAALSASDAELEETLGLWGEDSRALIEELRDVGLVIELQGVREGKRCFLLTQEPSSEVLERAAA